MADTPRSLFRKYCKYYYDGFCPRGNACSYPHKTQLELEQTTHKMGQEFLIARLRIKRSCRYFLLGNCKHNENCFNTHDLNASPRSYCYPKNNHPQDFVDVEDDEDDNSANMPSTSSKSNSEVAAVSEETTALSGTIQNAQENLSQLNNNKTTMELEPAETMNDDERELEGACASPTLTVDSWVNAPEFVPKYMYIKPRSYAEALNINGEPGVPLERNGARRLCPYVNKDGECRNLVDCTYLHGELCDLCERLVLHPFNEEQRKRHRQECIQQHEKNMELSFAVARSKEKTCGVCFEIIMEKASGEQRFGILPNCNHCFCLTCIRKWRQARQFENKIIRACPECRVTSDFVCPSMYWVDTKEDKDKLIDDYKNALARKDCKYFNKGHGKCPFGNKCFYLHAFPDGRKCDVGPPPRQLRRRDNVDIEQVMLWDFFEERDFPWQSLADELEDLVSFFTDSDDLDYSDYDAYND